MKHLLAPAPARCADADTKTLRVFIFAGQSNMEGADSKVKDIQRFPPFAGLDMPQDKVLFAYSIGRETKRTSDGWVALQPVGTMVGPELSFARRESQNVEAPIAIIKCAAGGTTLGGDWNPDDPSGFKLYPLALQLIQSSLAELDRKNVPYRIEGFMWHQGENDMFNKEFKPAYGKNLNFLLAPAAGVTIRLEPRGDGRVLLARSSAGGGQNPITVFSGQPPIDGTPPAVLSALASRPDGLFELNFSGIPGLHYQVFTSEDLSTWQLWQNFVPDDSSFSLFDPEAAYLLQRFYKLVFP